MEPPDLKSNEPYEDALDALLRRASVRPALPDDGFSHRVLAALPAPPPRRRVVRTTFCVAGALAGLIVSASPFLWRGNPFESLPVLDAELLRAFAELANPAVGLAVGITAVSLLYVFWPKLRQLV